MYFLKKGPANTAATVELALSTARERGLKNIVVASGSGETALLLAGHENLNVVCVSSAYGFSKNGENLMKEAARQELERKGIRVHFASHVLSGVERGLSSEHGGMYPAEIMAGTLRMFGQGVKVCVEISIMGLDAGLVPYGEQIIAVGGSGRGADTAVIISPAHANRVLETRVNEILCKPF